MIISPLVAKGLVGAGLIGSGIATTVILTLPKENSENLEPKTTDKPSTNENRKFTEFINNGGGDEVIAKCLEVEEALQAKCIDDSMPKYK